MKDSVPVINLNTLQNDILPYLETYLSDNGKKIQLRIESGV